MGFSGRMRVPSMLSAFCIEVIGHPLGAGPDGRVVARSPQDACHPVQFEQQSAVRCRQRAPVAASAARGMSTKCGILSVHAACHGDHMCFPGNEHPYFDASLQALTGHWRVSGFLIRGLVGRTVKAVEDAQLVKRPLGLITRNAHSSAGMNTTLHYARKSGLTVEVICIADDRRDSAGHCLNLLLVAVKYSGGGWIVHQNPFQVGADRAI